MWTWVRGALAIVGSALTVLAVLAISLSHWVMTWPTGAADGIQVRGGSQQLLGLTGCVISRVRVMMWHVLLPFMPSNKEVGGERWHVTCCP